MKVYQHLDLNIGSSILADISILHKGIKDPNLELSWHWDLELSDLDPKFLALLKSKDLHVISAQVFKTNFLHLTWPIHVDHKDVGDYPRMNWVYGNQECPMIWYKEKDPTHVNVEKITATGDTYHIIDPNSVEEIDRTFVKTPTIVQAGAPHTVINSSNKNRWCVSIVLMKDDHLLTFDELVNEFKDYAV